MAKRKPEVIALSQETKDNLVSLNWQAGKIRELIEAIYLTVVAEKGDNKKKYQFSSDFGSLTEIIENKDKKEPLG